ncbi:hypothetical protein K490DRAFT_39645 [Saccharata proteae CBS 121410]|uniref:COP9 signalosome complex subunit 3 N-terminal helical repeats domain-containing protein n=1 Tax=Saccharata proteae CBS 121410 TaxID=1314787 RepID=A0A9P4I0M9_9PEZI|nr:hypothetical protein K490DRAFT_39645 [Saccharata proteae CBS 121410]
MAELAATLFSFPPDESNLEQLSPKQYDDQIHNYLGALAKLPKNWAKSTTSGSDDLLEILNPAVNSIPYLHVLLARIHGLTDRAKSIPDTIRPEGKLWNHMIQFINVCDPIQIRYVGGPYRELIEVLDGIVRALDTPGLGVEPIRIAMMRMDPTLGTFTSNHLLYLRLCHEVQAHREAVAVLDNYIYSFPKERINGGELTLPCADHLTSNGYITSQSGISDKLEPGHVHEYFMLGANSYLALRQYSDAQLYLEHILTAPTQNVADGLMAEAYRKWLLVGCLIDGVPPPALKTTNVNAFKTIRAASKAYETIADVFSSGDATKLSAEIHAGWETWENDGNTGLIRKLETHLNRFFVKNLQKTYAAIPVSTVAKWMNQSTSATTTYIQTLIDDCFLNATIEQTPPSTTSPTTTNTDYPIVRFRSELSSGFTKSEEQQRKDLLQQARRTQQLAEHVKQASQRLGLSKEFVELEKRKAKSKEGEGQQGPGAGGAGGAVGVTAPGGSTGLVGAETMDTSWEVYDQDEDMMGDIA